MTPMRQWTYFAAVVVGSAVPAAMVSPLAAVAILAGAALVVLITSTRCTPVTLLTAYLVLLFGIPAQFVVGPLGAVGTPALLVALVGAGWWGIDRYVLPGGSRSGLQPVRAAAMAFLELAVLSWGWGFGRPLDGLEARSADRWLIALTALVGITLLAADGIDSRERLDTLLRRLVGAGVFLASIGIVQYATGLNPAEVLRLPGLRLNGALLSVTRRGDVLRVAGTALHGIEFGVVLAMILPIALHYAFVAPPAHRARRWVAVALIVVAIPMSVSRSAIVGVLAVLLMLWPTWSWPRRVNVVAATVAGSLLVRAGAHGLLGTIKGLILGAGTDSSVSARLQDYGPVLRLWRRSPLLGQGLGTFLPQETRFLDNQYLATLVETGIAGVLMLTILLLVGISVARGARRRSDNPVDRDLGQSLAASMLVAIVTFGTFDALSFPINAGVLFVVIGCAGALWRLVDQERAPHRRFPASAGVASGPGASARGWRQERPPTPLVNRDGGRDLVAAHGDPARGDGRTRPRESRRSSPK